MFSLSVEILTLCIALLTSVSILITIILKTLLSKLDFPDGSDGKASAQNAGDLGSVPGLEISPGEGNGNPLQDSCLENPMDAEAWQAIVHGVAKNRTQMNDFTFTTDSWLNSRIQNWEYGEVTVEI